MKSIFKYTLLCLMALSGYGQKQNANWAISIYGGLNFNSSSPTTFTSAMDFNNLSSGSVSDQEGNLLFYTDGLTVWDQTHSTMTNGTGLYGFGGDFTQNIVIVPNPADINKYYVFYISVGQDLGQTLHGLRYSEVDMTDGIGVIDNATKNTPLTDNSLVDIDDAYSPNYGKITSARHANGLDYWLIAEIGSDIFSYLIDDSGIHVNATASTAPLPSAWYWFINGSQTGSGNGPIKISPDNTKILIGYTSAFDAGHSE
ncbi:MAG TPA: hypothetical protein VK476_06890, partial [Flavobacterium sp.]|nr:hypothetical protein [Flavobacterium sp.]